MADKYVKLDDIIETLEHEWGYEGMREDLERLPTADVVEVVRCYECKYGEHYKCTVDPCYNHMRCARRENYTEGVDTYDFCSYGERRDN